MCTINNRKNTFEKYIALFSLKAFIGFHTRCEMLFEIEFAMFWYNCINFKYVYVIYDVYKYI